MDRVPKNDCAVENNGQTLLMFIIADISVDFFIIRMILYSFHQVLGLN